MKVIETLWFSNIFGCVGVVVVEEDITADRKAYIGAAPGFNENADIDAIISDGNPFSLETIKRLQRLLTKKKGGSKWMMNGRIPI